MAAATTSAAGKTPLTIENVQDAVVKALATTAPAAAAFAGMHEMERGNGFGLVEHTAFGAMAEGETADDENSGAEEINKQYTSKKRPHHAEKFIWKLSVVAMVISALVLIVSIWSYLSNYAGEVSGNQCQGWHIERY